MSFEKGSREAKEFMAKVRASKNIAPAVIRPIKVYFEKGNDIKIVDKKPVEIWFCNINGVRYEFPIGQKVEVPQEVFNLLVNIGHPAAKAVE